MTHSAQPNSIALGEQLDRVVQSRVGQETVTWTIFSIFTAAHAVLFAGFIARNDAFAGPTTSVVLCLVGIASAAVWGHILRRSLKHLALQEDLIGTLEEALKLPSHICVSRKMNPELKDRLGGITARPVMMGAVILTGFAWLIVLLVVSRLWLLGS